MANEMPDVLASPGFYSWLRNAKKGETLVYHIGLLAADKEVFLSASGHYIPRQPLFKLAEQVYDAYEKGHVVLVQKRLEASAGGGAMYLAVRTGRRLRHE